MTSLNDNAVIETFDEATKLKDQARISTDNLDLYLKAAERFHAAGELSDKLSRSSDYTEETRLQARLFAQYYFYEEHDCRCSASYERHDLQQARQFHFRGVEHLRSAIKMTEEALPSVKEDCAAHLRENQLVWQHFLFGSEIEFLSIEAREAWDNGRLIVAIDMYRSMLSKFPKMIEHAEDSQLTPVYRRIARGNYLGTQINVSQAFCQMFVDRATRESLPLDLSLMLLKDLFEAHQLGLAAYRENPEWEDYRTNADKSLNNIRQFLADNRDLWPEVYLAFEDQPKFHALMKEVDGERFKEVQSVPHPVVMMGVAQSDARVNHVVLLIHGIRTEADWQEMVVAQIETPGTKVLPIKYGYFDVFQFLLPGPTRRGPIQRVLKEIRLAQVQYPGAKLSVIAHSFGTYIVSQVIQKNFDIKLHRTLFCGSVIPATYPWESVFHQFAGVPVLNECGKGDIWPVIAQSVTWGYGATGTHGFGTVVVKDRYHPGGHSQYFDKEFVAKYWVPFIQNGEIRPSEWEKERPTTPLGLSLLGRLPLRYLLLSLAILAAAFVAWRIVVNFLYPNTTNAEPGLLI